MQTTLKAIKDEILKGDLQQASALLTFLCVENPKQMFNYFRSYTIVDSKTFTASVDLEKRSFSIGTAFFFQYVNSLNDLEIILCHERDHYVIRSAFGEDFLDSLPARPIVAQNFVEDAYINARNCKKIPSNLFQRYYEDKDHKLFLQPSTKEFEDWVKSLGDKIPKGSSFDIVELHKDLNNTDIANPSNTTEHPYVLQRRIQASNMSYKDYLDWLVGSQFFEHYLQLLKTKEERERKTAASKSGDSDEGGKKMDVHSPDFETDSADGETSDDTKEESRKKSNKGDGESDDNEELKHEGDELIGEQSKKSSGDTKKQSSKEGIFRKIYVDSFDNKTLLNLLLTYPNEKDIPIDIEYSPKVYKLIIESKPYRKLLSHVVGKKATKQAMGERRVSSPYLPVNPDREDLFLSSAGIHTLDYIDHIPSSDFLENDGYTLYLDVSGSTSDVWTVAAHLVKNAGNAVSRIVYFSGVCVDIEREELEGTAPFVLTTGTTESKKVADDIIDTESRNVIVFTDAEDYHLGEDRLEELDEATDELIICLYGKRGTIKSGKTIWDLPSGKTKYVDFNEIVLNN